MSSSGAPGYSDGGGLKGMLVFVLSFPLLFKALMGLWGGYLSTFLSNAAAYGLVVLGGILLRRGLIAEGRAAVRPALSSAPPLKAFAAAAIAGGTAVAAFAAAGHGWMGSVLFGLGAALGCVLYYGLDPEPRPQPSLRHGSGADEARAALREAYGRLDGINEARQGIHSREFQERLSAIVMQSELILKAIENDPRDLRRARRFLNVYLDGILSVTQQYARTHPQSHSQSLEQNYRALLVDMERVCREQHQKLMQDDVEDLDIQIEVLSKRLRQQGVN